MLKKIGTFRTHHKVLFSIIIGIGVVAFWRGAWGLMDAYILPENYEMSSWITLVAGIVILYTTHHIVKELM